MTKTHFIAFAAELKFRRATPTGHDIHDAAALNTWRDCVEGVADVCQQASPRFDRERFLRACGMDDEVPGHRAAMERAS